MKGLYKTDLIILSKKTNPSLKKPAPAGFVL